MNLTDNEIIKAFETCYKGYDELLDKVCDVLNRQKAERKDLFYKLEGVMHSVDKWLDGDELKQDEVNRAATMREKTLQIMEQQKADVDFYKERSSKYKAQVEVLLEQTKKQQAEIERLNGSIMAGAETVRAVEQELETAKSTAIKEFAERFGKWLGYYEVVCIEQQNWCARDVTSEIRHYFEEMVGGVDE